MSNDDDDDDECCAMAGQDGSGAWERSNAFDPLQDWSNTTRSFDW